MSACCSNYPNCCCYENLGKKEKGEPILTVDFKEKEIPRNRPCPCKSGKKYKHCCAK